MIDVAASFIRDELGRYLLSQNAVNIKGDVLLGNIAFLESQQNLSDKVVLSLVNIEEESALKNSRSYIKNVVNNTIESVSPTVHLNLYILFTATLSESDASIDENYQKALHRISGIIEFFQSKNVFTIQNSSGYNPPEINENLLAEIRLLPELYTLTFEQINHLWGSLGGKQSPSVMYKFRLVKIHSRVSTAVPVIDTINNNMGTTAS
jgi:Pvc16 N-terminal domain